MIPEPVTSEQAPGAVPPGTPSWITAELISRTISVWQRFYSTELTAADAVEMLTAAENLFAVMQDAARNQGRSRHV